MHNHDSFNDCCRRRATTHPRKQAGFAHPYGHFSIAVVIPAVHSISAKTRRTFLATGCVAISQHSGQSCHNHFSPCRYIASKSPLAFNSWGR